MKIGIIGFDTGHSYVLPKKIKEFCEKNPEYRDCITFEFGWPGAPETAIHKDMLEKFYQEVAEQGIKTEKNIDKLIKESDGFLLESVNGYTHCELAEKILPTKKPVFIDKPLANTIEDAARIVKLAEKYGTPCWSGSSLRFEPETLKVVNETAGNREADLYGAADYFENGRGFFYYGIHIAEMLLTIMGTGVEKVQTCWSENCEVITGFWKDGRTGILRGQRVPRPSERGGIVHGGDGKSCAFKATGDFYMALAEKLVKFFLKSEVPVKLNETLEIIAFLEAAVRSKEANGRIINLKDIL